MQGQMTIATAMHWLKLTPQGLLSTVVKMRVWQHTAVFLKMVPCRE